MKRFNKHRKSKSEINIDIILRSKAAMRPKIMKGIGASLSVQTASVYCTISEGGQSPGNYDNTNTTYII